MKGVVKIFLLLQIPFWAGYGYIYLNVQKSVMERKVHILGLRQSELKKRNGALKKEIARLNKYTDLNSHTGGFSLFGKNKVINLELPPLPTHIKK